MKKKKLLALGMVAALGTTAVVGGTLAYFTDTDSAENVMTVGKVDIELLEHQRSEDGTKLVDFVDGTKLLPIVESAQTDEKDAFGLTTSGNYVDKIVRVKNIGSEEAFVRVLVAVPSELDNKTDAGKNILHWNVGNKFDAAGDKADGQTEVADWKNWDWKFEQAATLAEKKDGDNVVIREGEYNIYSFVYNKEMTADKITDSACVVGFYLDKNVDCNVDAEGKVTYTIGDETIDYDLENGVTIPVFAQGVQADGFTDKNSNGTAADEAFGAAGLPVVPWTTK